jgi:alpha-tubulin suppressor-like RCC1 family protein
MNLKTIWWEGIRMFNRFKSQVKRSSIWCLILLLMSTLLPTTSVLASPGLSYSSIIAGGSGHTIALNSNGTVWTWGSNEYGQLGDGTTTDRRVPAQVSGLRGVVAVAGGFKHTIALKNDGTVWTWGWNNSGQLGEGTDSYRTTPVQVSGISGVVAIASRGNHTIALKNDGTVWTWGSNGFGQLGNGTITNPSITPVQVSGLSDVVAIASGGFHTIALKKDGTVWTWGLDDSGQLGDGPNDHFEITPVQVSGLDGVVAIAGGSKHTIALKNDGTVWTWGFNDKGQLGDGTTTKSSLPVPV